MTKESRHNGSGNAARSAIDATGENAVPLNGPAQNGARKEASLDVALPTMLAQAVQSSMDMIGVTNIAGEFTFVNESFVKMSGRKREELLDTHFGLVLSPENTAAVLEEIGTKGLADGGWSGECILRRKDQSDFSVFLNVGPVKDKSGRLTGMFGIGRDISDQKKSEQLLRRSEEKFRELAEHIRVVFFVTTAEPFAITYVSPAYEQILGRSPEQLYGEPNAWIETMHPEDRERVIGVLAESQKGIETKTEYRIVRPDGAVRWLRTDTYPVCDSQGQLVRLVGIIEDITEQRARDEALRKSEEQFRQLADNIHELFFVIVPDPFQVAYLSPAYEQIWGRSRQEVYENPLAWVDSIHPDDRGIIASIFEKRDVQEETTFRIVRPNRTIRWIAVRSFPVFDQSGRLTRAVGVAEDITVRREREEALVDAHEKLRSAVAKLESQNDESAKLSELVDILQSCQSIDEAYKITENGLQGMLQSSGGALCITSPSRDVVEVVAGWGETLGTERVFRPDDCWALRRGKVHRVKDPNSPLRCKHVSKSLTTGYVCVPLAAQGETLGVLFAEGVGPIHSVADDDHLETLVRRATAAGERMSLAMASLRLREVLRGQSIRDPLTGLFNRRFMEESLERELRRAVRGKQQLALLMLDIDYFKRFNDMFGHQAGDALLRALGNLLRESTRGQDVVCRYGGEEFAFVLAGASLDAATKRAELLRADVKQLNVQHGGQLLGSVTLSVGIAVFPENGDTTEKLLKAADDALYRAKNEGRDRLVVA